MLKGERLRWIAVLPCLVVALGVAQDASGGLGLGVVAGEPSGLSAKMWLSDAAALDAAAGWSLGENGWMYLHADYLHHRYDLRPPELERGLPYYIGIGFRLLLRDEHDSRLGVRVPLGLDYVFEEAPVDVFLELAPVVNLIPETELGLSGGIGVRYWF